MEDEEKRQRNLFESESVFKSDDFAEDGRLHAPRKTPSGNEGRKKTQERGARISAT